MSFPKYPAYKDSGVGWIGEVPIGWNIVPLKRIFSLKNGATPKSDQSDLWDGEITWITPADLNFERPEIITHSKRTISVKGAESCAVSIVPKGSIIISTRAPIGSIGLSGIDLCTNQGCRSLVPDEGVSSRFFLYFLYSAVSELQVLGKGTTFLELSSDSLASFSSCFPSLPEQQAIASFLDCECGKIDTLIAEQERMIALLAEKRQAIISHAVTKGLNPNAPMKDSGILWIGMVPERWEIRKLKSISRLETGHTPSRQHPEYWVKQECKIPWFTLADVGFLRDDRNIYINKTEQKISQIGLDNSAARILPSESVILSRTASVGFSGITTLPLAVSQDFSVWICGKSLWPRYLLLCLRSMRNEFRRLMMGSTHQTIYMPDIEAIRVPLPPLDEQIAITNHLFDTTNKMDASIAEITHSISLLKERRAALISAAVTGKIDVRAQSKAIAA